MKIKRVIFGSLVIVLFLALIIFYISPLTRGARNIDIVPANVYLAIPNNGVTADMEILFNLNWLKSFPQQKILRGELISPDQNALTVEVRNTGGKGGCLAIRLPSRQITSEGGIINLTWDLPVGLYHFNDLKLYFSDGMQKKYPLGNLFIEVLPETKVMIQQNNAFEKVFEINSVRYPRQNPCFLICYKNSTSKPVALTGIHLPPEFPYALDISSLSVKRGADFEKEVAAFQNRIVLNQKVIKEKTYNFTKRLDVAPGEKIALSFSLAASSPDAYRSFVGVDPILETSEHLLILPNTLPVGGGPWSHSRTDLIEMLYKW
ncbi:MAG: hypothetical protein WC364_10890 [Eubacteriales bacterium]|jgi:hypothetical protein